MRQKNCGRTGRRVPACRISFDGDVRNAGYIATGIELVKADKRAFFTACNRASKAADYFRGLALAEPADRSVSRAMARAMISRTQNGARNMSRRMTLTREPARTIAVFFADRALAKSLGRRPGLVPLELPARLAYRDGPPTGRFGNCYIVYRILCSLQHRFNPAAGVEMVSARRFTAEPTRVGRRCIPLPAMLYSYPVT